MTQPPFARVILQRLHQLFDLAVFVCMKTFDASSSSTFSQSCSSKRGYARVYQTQCHRSRQCYKTIDCTCYKTKRYCRVILIMTYSAGAHDGHSSAPTVTCVMVSSLMPKYHEM